MQNPVYFLRGLQSYFYKFNYLKTNGGKFSMPQQISKTELGKINELVTECGLSFEELQLATRFWSQYKIPGARMRSEIDWPKGMHDWSGPQERGWTVSCRKCGRTPYAISFLDAECPL
jgi:hypothetical protein